MKVADLKKLPEATRKRVPDAEEGMVDALLNILRCQTSGENRFGDVVYGTKPSNRFVSGFLLPRFDESMAEDETSDIRLSTIGMDFQVATASQGELVVNAGFAVYIRVLPTWDDLIEPKNAIWPRHMIRTDLQKTIRTNVGQAFKEAWARERQRPYNEQRSRQEIRQGIYQRELAEHGIRIVDGGVMAGEEEDGHDDRVGLIGGQLQFDSDSAALPEDIPEKWIRIPVDLPEFRVSFTQSRTEIETAAGEWAKRAQQLAFDTVDAWVASETGQAWAYRAGQSVMPSHVRSREAWEAYLYSVRRHRANTREVAPKLSGQDAYSGLKLYVRRDADLNEPDRSDFRVAIENNSGEAAKNERRQKEQAIHQVWLSVRMPAADHRPLRLERVEPSYRYSDFLDYPALGVNCGVDEKRADDDLILSTTWMPRYVQPRIEPTSIADLTTAYAELGADGFNPSDLKPLVDDYKRWIDREEKEANPARGVKNAAEREREEQEFAEDIRAYRKEVRRIELGIELLEHAWSAYQGDPNSRTAAPYRAWLLLNRAFEQAGARKGFTDWRLFQLAFILAHISTLASRMPEYATRDWFDRDTDEQSATLLYFPTGGGKSEAFFGLLLFNLFLDRLRGKEIGVTAMLRYPLRLLTLQQAQRLHHLLVNAELLRLKAGVPGAPFTIGFWVGSANTPNNINDDRLKDVPKVNDARYPDDSRLMAQADYRSANEGINKITSCPVCQESTGLRRYEGALEDRLGIFCFNNECDWNRSNAPHTPLPFHLIDTDIYSSAPAVILGTIDKLAMIGQHESTIRKIAGMFGAARWRSRRTGELLMPRRKGLQEGPEHYDCDVVAPAYSGGVEVFHDPFPSLTVQDEAHLLDESLGTFASLFETTLEETLRNLADVLGHRVARLPFADGAGVRQPRLAKVVAATATVSVPEQQFGALYQRRHLRFPHPGTSIYRSFYSAPREPAIAGRKGLAKGRADAPEIESPWMRVYASLMTNGKTHTVTTVNVLSAYHATVTRLWNSLQDAGRQSAVIDELVAALSPDDPARDFREAALREVARDPVLLLTLLDLLRISLTYVTNKKGGDQVIDAFQEEAQKWHEREGETLRNLKTQLISGGIDIASIQSIMQEAEDETKAGRNFPDLSTALRNIVATSAISHGVDVDQFNAMFFAGMPSDIAEFIQASSRVGRTHTGFSLLIPTPQSRRDRYIVETHDIFHRFLERMIAPPAITRWADSAIERVLTSLFQAWLVGYVEHHQFAAAGDLQKTRAPTYYNVSTVCKLFNGHNLPNAERDFLDFAVKALGVDGRGSERIGRAPHKDHYENLVRNAGKAIVDAFKRVDGDHAYLRDFWADRMNVPHEPMKSLRDIEEGGVLVPTAMKRNRNKQKQDNEEQNVKYALRVVRRQRAGVDELGADE